MAKNPLDNPDVKNKIDDAAESAKDGADGLIDSIDTVIVDVLNWTKDFIIQSWELLKSIYHSLIQ
jgi:hypothetical protein